MERFRGLSPRVKPFSRAVAGRSVSMGTQTIKSFRPPAGLNQLMPRHNSLDRGWRMSVGGAGDQWAQQRHFPDAKVNSGTRSNRYSRRHGVASPALAHLRDRDPHRPRDGPPIALWDQLGGLRWRSQVRRWYVAGSLGISPRFPLLTEQKAASSMYGYGDLDGPGFSASGDESVRRAGNRLPFGAMLRGSPAGAGGGLCPL